MADVAHTRTLVFAGHRGAGKTTLIERILADTKQIDRMGDVDAGTTHGDYLDEEKAHKFTVSLKLLHTEYEDHRFYLVDVPGYLDLQGELEAALRAVDTVLIVVDATAGVSVGAVRAWRRAEAQGLPRAIFVTRLDKENTNFVTCLTDIQSTFGDKCVPVVLPIGREDQLSGVYNLLEGGEAPADVQGDADALREQLIERAAEGTDALTEKYLEEGELSAADVAAGLKAGILSGTVVPVLCGSAVTGAGIRALLDFAASSLPSPADRGTVEAVNGETGTDVAPDPNAPFSALVFKNLADPFLGNLTLMRVMSGTLKADTGFTNITKGQKERIGHILLLQGKEQTHLATAGPGDVIAVAKLKHTSTGDTLGDGEFAAQFKPIAFPHPVVKLAIDPVARADEDKIMEALHKIVAEDPTLRVERNRETGEDLILGMGDMHLKLVTERLKTRYRVDATTRRPKIAYKEAIKKTTSARYRHKKQTGGKGQFGEVELEISPLPSDQHFEFVNDIRGGVIAGGFIPAVEKGVRERMERGVVAGYPVVNVKCRLYDGMQHTVDSSEMAFKLAGSHAFRLACESNAMCLLEPIVNVEVQVPDELMGEINGLLTTKRGRIQGMDTTAYGQVIQAQMPEAEMIGFNAELRSHTAGRGTYEMQFSHYEEVPGQVAEKIIADAKVKKDED